MQRFKCYCFGHQVLTDNTAPGKRADTDIKGFLAVLVSVCRYIQKATVYLHVQQTVNAFC